MKLVSDLTGKILYTITFVIILPIGLFFWAKYTQDVFPFPKTESKTIGCLMMCAGGVLLLWAMVVLNIFGKGLPMNAYPPLHFVTQGPYRIIRHPIYFGFGILVTGWFVYSGSASGVWLVSPITIVGMIALVMGYEALDLRQRFPNHHIITLFDLPEDNDQSPGLRDRLTTLFKIISCLIINNYAIATWTGSSSSWPAGSFRIDPGLRNDMFGCLNVIFLLLIPFSLKRKQTLRKWEISGIIAMSFDVFFGLLLPSVGALHNLSQHWSLFNVPVFLLLISLKAILSLPGQRSVLLIIIAAILLFTGLTYSQFTVIVILYSILMYLLSVFYLEIWIFLKNNAEKIANSWQEWTFGKIRVINHGLYVGAGAFFGILLASILVGKDYSWALLFFGVLVTVCSALWAQIIEGSEKLKRPFGYYGGLVGIIIGSFVVWVMRLDVWVVIGVVSVIMPWIQAIGRLRCLVNGCCHGSRVYNPNIGIRYFHPRSRVCNISALKGELIHPTPLYSFLWLFFVGLVLLSLWNKGLSYSFLFGLYLILTGIGRFVEEAYRGEVQTPIVRGLRLYQWIALFSVIIGILMTIIHVRNAKLTPGFSWEGLWVSVISGLFVFFMMGVDFPFSNARFSRLT